jgi:hypothetical protein
VRSGYSLRAAGAWIQLKLRLLFVLAPHATRRCLKGSPGGHLGLTLLHADGPALQLGVLQRIAHIRHSPQTMDPLITVTRTLTITLTLRRFGARSSRRPRARPVVFGFGSVQIKSFAAVSVRPSTDDSVHTRDHHRGFCIAAAAACAS